MRKYLALAAILISGCATHHVWYINGQESVTCNVSQHYQVKLQPRTIVNVTVHLANGHSIVSPASGSHAGEVLTCPTERVSVR